jgi:hypothetical protein
MLRPVIFTPVNSYSHCIEHIQVLGEPMVLLPANERKKKKKN